MTMRPLTIEERRQLRALAPSIQQLAKVTRAHTDTLRHALAGGLISTPVVQRLRAAIDKGKTDEK